LLLAFPRQLWVLATELVQKFLLPHVDCGLDIGSCIYAHRDCRNQVQTGSPQEWSIYLLGWELGKSVTDLVVHSNPMDLPRIPQEPAEGVDTATIVRLTKFSELNTIRVLFRFLFTVPLLILGVDGVRPHTHINESMLWTDFLIMVAGFGCVISSAITLVIFFPRSIEGEIAARDAAKERKRTRSLGHSANMADSIHGQNSSHRGSSVGGAYLLTSSPVKQNFDLHSFDDHDAASHEDESKDVPAALPSLKPNRKRGQDIEMSRVESLSESNLSVHNLRGTNINPMISNFKSPIDFSHADDQNVNSSRLTFNRR